MDVGWPPEEGVAQSAQGEGRTEGGDKPWENA